MNATLQHKVYETLFQRTVWKEVKGLHNCLVS